MRRSSLVHLHARIPRRTASTRDWCDRGRLPHGPLHRLARDPVDPVRTRSSAFARLLGDLGASSASFLALVFLPAHVGSADRRASRTTTGSTSSRPRGTSRCRSSSRSSSSASTTRSSTTCSPRSRTSTCPRPRRSPRRGARVMASRTSVPYLYALIESAKFMASAWTHDAADPIEVRAGLFGHAPTAPSAPMSYVPNVVSRARSVRRASRLKRCPSRSALFRSSARRAGQAGRARTNRV